MFSIYDLADDVSTVTVEYRGRTTTVTYRPSTYTAEFMNRTDPLPLVEMLAELLDSWELVDRAGAPLPIDATVMQGLPFGFLSAVHAAVRKDALFGGLGEVSGSLPAG